MSRKSELRESARKARAQAIADQAPRLAALEITLSNIALGKALREPPARPAATAAPVASADGKVVALHPHRGPLEGLV